MTEEAARARNPYSTDDNIDSLSSVSSGGGRSAGTTATTASSEAPSLPPLAPPSSATNLRQQGGGDQAFTPYFDKELQAKVCNVNVRAETLAVCFLIIRPLSAASK